MATLFQCVLHGEDGKSELLFVLDELSDGEELTILIFSLKKRLPTAISQPFKDIPPIPQSIEVGISKEEHFDVDFESFEDTWAITLIHPADDLRYTRVLSKNELAIVKALFLGELKWPQ